MARILSVALLSFCYILSAQADIYSASNALSRGDYETAVAEFTKLAEKGDASAQANLGYMYYAGEGVPQDYEKAVYWYRKAATQGNRDAQYNLAVSYAFGEGAKQDLTEAAIWYRRAGEQGHVVSQYSLGISYAYGEGVPQDQKEAARWFKKAADQGYARAQVQLGSMYHTGEGVEQDYLEASRWYRLAADRGDATAQYNLGTMYRSGKGVEQNYAQAKRWFRQSADQGYAAAQNELASLERSAAANIATRTIQTKPSLPTVTETTPEPAPVKKAEPVAEVVPSQKTESAVSAQVTTPKDNESKKEPLFSVEKEGLLSLDDSDLDIAKPEVTVETKVEEVIPVETDTEVSQEIETVDSSAINNALGIQEPSETEEEGFFSKLFTKKESTETENIVTEKEPVVEEVIPEPKVKKEFVTTPRVYPEDIKAAELAELEKNKVVEDKPEETIEEPVVAEEEPSEGFFSRLFSNKGKSNDEVDTTEETTEEIVEVAEEVIPEEPKVKNEFVTTPRVYPEDIKAAELAELEKSKVVEDEPEETIEEPVVTEEEPSEGFFNRLFSSNGKSNDEVGTTEETTEEIAEVVEAEPVIEVAEEVTPETDVVEETVIAENNWAEQDTSEADKESSGNLFSAIGDFFSGGNKPEQAEITETENEDVLIAKAEEPIAINEEIELTQDAEVDLNQYSVHTGRRALTNGDYDEAYKQFKPLADAGDSEAQAHLGSLYYVGKGVSKDLELAYSWYKKSADQGNIDAQYSVGNMFLLGEGVEQNNTDAAKWYALASDQGHVAAQNNLESLEKLEALNRENQLKLEAMEAEQKAKENTVTEVEEESVVKSYAAGEAPTAEPLQTLYPEEVAAEEVIDEIEQADKIATVNEPQAESPGFFESLFGSNDKEEPAEADNDELEVSEKIENTSTEVAAVEPEIKVPEEVEIEEVIPEEAILAETETEIETRVSIEEQSDEDITKTTDEVETEKESGGLFGFLGSVFSPKDKDESDNTDPDFSEENTPEEIAILETEVKAEETNIDEIVVDEIKEEVIVKSELDQLRQLATQGDQDSQYKLGTFYYSGNEVKLDYAQAALWYRRAAEQGNVEAQYSLGNMFLMGEGVGQNDNQAAHWYTLAAEQGHSSAQHNLESLQNMLATNTVIETETPSNNSQLVSLDDQSIESTPSEDISGKSEYEQGLAYAFGDGVRQNDREAFNFFYESAEKGYVLAQYKLGVAFAYGEGVRQDSKQAAEWYRKAAQQGHTIAQRNLATMYLNGTGVEQNKVQALAWYQVVANAGNAMDQRRRDMLKEELSEVELSESMTLSKQISNSIRSPSL